MIIFLNKIVIYYYIGSGKEKSEIERDIGVGAQ